MRLLALVPFLALLALAAPAAAVTVDAEWNAGTGPIVAYDLHVSRDGGATFALERSITTAANPVQATLEANAGDVVVAFVRARAADGRTADGPRSDPFTVPAALDCTGCKVRLKVTLTIEGSP